MKIVPRSKSGLDFIEIDAGKMDIDLIHRNLEANPSGVLSLYNYLREKGIIEIAES